MTQSTKKIGLVMAIIISLNAMIGASIFTTPAALQLSAGPAALLTYLFVTFAVWCLAQSFAHLAQRYPGEGSFYTYAFSWGGKAAGLAASALYLCGLVVALGLLTKITGAYLHDYIASTPANQLGLILLLFLILFNISGVIISSASQIVLFVLTIFPLLSIIVLCLLKADINNILAFLPPKQPLQIFYAIKFAVFGFLGFECAPALYAAVKNPQKNVPWALSISVVLVGFIYLFFMTSLMLALPPTSFSTPEQPLSQALLRLFPTYTWIVQAIHVSILVTIAGTIHAMLWSVGSLITSIAHKCSYRITLSRAIIYTGTATGFSSVFFKDIGFFFSTTTLAIVAGYALSIIALFKNRGEAPPHQLVIASCALGTAILMMLCSLQGIL